MKEYIPLLAESGKQFLVLGNMNHITFKEIFHYFRENKMWLGYNAGHFWFKVSDYTKPRILITSRTRGKINSGLMLAVLNDLNQSSAGGSAEVQRRDHCRNKDHC